MKIRIGNDFKTKWAITWLGEPEDFSDATDIALFFNIYDKKIELTKDVDYTITDNIIEIDVTPDICNILGVYNLELHYTKPNDDFIDGERRSAVDIDAFRIVGKSEKADSTQDVSIISDAVAIFLDIAYKKLEEIEANEVVRISNEGEREDAEDIRVENENTRISNEQDRQINTTTAISNAEQATLNANNSAVYANEQGAYAEEMSLHPPTIINDYWHIWNFTSNQYESTGQYARGDSAIDGALVLQEKGQSAVNTMSQKAVTDELIQLESDVEQLELYKPVQNKILNIHKYGVPSEITSPAEANLWNEDDFFYHPNLFRCTAIPLAVNGMTGRFFGAIIDNSTVVTSFHTRDEANAQVAQYQSILKNGKRLIYVDLSVGSPSKIYLHLSGSVKIYDLFLTDEVPTFNLIPYEFNDTVEWEDLFWKERDPFTPVITPAYTYNVLAYPADIRLNSFKRYVFFRVRSSLPDTRPQTLYFDTLNNSAQLIKRSHVRWSREWAYVDLGENLDSIRYLRLVSYSGTQAQAGSWLQLYDIRTSSSLSLNAVRGLDYPSFETAFEGKDRKLDYFRVGSKIFTGSAPSVIRKDNDFTAGGWSDLSMYDYTGKKISFKEARKQKVVDLASRYLSCITPEGEMYFKNGTAIEKIDVDTFLNSIQSHDGTGLDYSRLSYINLPTDATALEKQAAFDSMKAEWYQFTGATEQVNPSGGKEIGQMFGNGNILFGTTLVREDGTIATPVLKNPVAGNPTHLIIKDESDAVLHEIPLYGNIAETYRWGSFIPNEGSIIYTEIVKSIINFTNEKTLTVALPTSLIAGTYKIVLRGRRFGTTLVNGDVEISSNDITLGAISLSGTGTKRALIDNEISVTTSSAINEIKMTLSCATEKPLSVGNGMTADGSWGRTADGRFGTIVEYVPAPERDGGKCYLTQDNGETWEDVFDVGLNELFGSGQGRVHLHGARYDRYWNKLYIVGGDYNENRAFHHADISTGTTIDNISWVHEPINGDEYKTSVTEQYCTVYPDVDHIHFGTDYTLSGMWRMNRINRNVMTGREPSFIVNYYRITHIPTSYFKADDGELFALSMLGDEQAVTDGFGWSTYASVRVDSTLDGVTWKEVWRNDVGGGNFGQNAYMNVHYFGNKLFLHIYGDGKFSTNHSLVILDYK